MPQKRLKILLAIIIALLSVLVFRLGYIQIIDGSKYSGISDKRRIKRRPLDALRGKIFDRDGVVLATNRHTFDISLNYNDILYYYLISNKMLLPRLTKTKSHKNSTASCSSCHNKQDELFSRLLEISDISNETLLKTTENIVKRIENIKKSVSTRKGKDIRIVEETTLHPVVKDVSFDKVTKIELYKKDFPDIFVEVKPYRWYPFQTMASHILGYTSEIKNSEWNKYRFKDTWLDCPAKDTDSGQYSAPVNPELIGICDEINDKKSRLDAMFASGYLGYVRAGKTGIEAYYNLSLLGKPGERFEEIKCEGSTIERIIIEQPSKTGENIYLTIDSKIQLLAEKALGNRTGAVVVMDPWNGEIIAMASNPRFNPNTFNEDFPEIIKNKRKPLLHRPVQSTLPPGSTYKIVTAAATLTGGIIDSDTLFECYGHAGTDLKRFRCFSKYGHGMLNVEEAIQYSCNVFFYKAGKKLGSELWYEWSRKFGFGEYSGIDLPYERKGMLPKPKSDLEMMNVSIGQGDLLVSPLQITGMTAIIANGGRSVQPHLLSKITDYSGNILITNKNKPGNRAFIPAEVVTIIKQGLRKVVISGTGKKMGIDKYLAAGKTGTAEIRKDGNNHTWFTGFAPYTDPKYCFTVIIENTPEHAGEATAPVLRPLLKGLFP